MSNEWDKARDAWQAMHSSPAKHKAGGGVTLLVCLGVLALLGAGVAYLVAKSAETDMSYHPGDGFTFGTANYAPAIVLAVAGCVLLLLAAILHGRD